MYHATTYWWGRAHTLATFVGWAFPRVNRELQGWEKQARSCQHPELRRQALASMHAKKFHCQGGSIFATRTPRATRPRLVRAIVALQTISDYLDNLCDRAGIQDEAAFTYLHQSFCEALAPYTSGTDYYARYPYREDGGYLQHLVGACQEALAGLPSYPRVEEEAQRLAGYYCRLQATKHVHPDLREARLRAWVEPLQAGQEEELCWWELAAACGSTLGLFALMHLASRPGVEEATARRVADVYFPWIGGLHILLDYFIDQEEDRRGGDFNFTACYRSPEEAADRLQWLLQKSLNLARGLPDPLLHLMVVEGLPAMYLSDPKATTTGLAGPAQQVLAAAGPGCRRLYQTCTALRRAGII